ncbi:hypothetical protein Tco_0402103 [Tanacetum coccineum]
MEIMKHLEQFEGIEHWCKAFRGLMGNKRVMETDLWLRVEGVSNVYALGDCATIYQCIVMVCLSPKQYQYTILSEAVTKMKGLLPNVQVATQHGNYLAKCFNGMKKCQHEPEGQLRYRDTGGYRFKPFRYMQLETLDKINQVAGFQLGSTGRFSWREFDQFDPN